VLIWERSEVHLEATRGWDLPFAESRPRFDVLVVAGDLIPRRERGVRWLSERVTDRQVIDAPGNHEVFGFDIDRTVEKAREAAAGTNIHILQNEAVTIEGVLFVGAALWTDFAPFGGRDLAMLRAADGLNDYHRIRVRRYAKRLLPAHTVCRHFETRGFIQRATREARAERMVVITHHGCVPQAVKSGTGNDILSAAYIGDYRDLLENVDLWIYGHTGESRDVMVGRTRIFGNSKGYGPWPPRETTWDNPRSIRTSSSKFERPAMTDKHDRSKPHRTELPLPASASEHFPTFDKRTVQDPSDLFVSVKVATPIPVRHPAVRDALIQASLDRRVRSISYVAAAVVASKETDLGAIVVQRDDGRFFLDVVEARRIRDLDDEGLALIALAELGLKPWVISAQQLRLEPHYTNAQFVWLYNGHRVPRELRKRILGALRDREPMALGELQRSVGSDRDPFNDVMALVCADQLELDLTSQPLQLTTIVRARRLPARNHQGIARARGNRILRLPARPRS